MRQFARIIDTIASVFSTRIGRIIVTDLATHGLCALSNARSLLVRLTGRKPARVYVVNEDRERPVGVPGAARILGNHCLSMTWSHPSDRPMRRGASDG